MILQRYPATLYARKKASTLEVKLPADALVRDFINQGTSGVYCYAETAGAPMEKAASVFMALKPGEDTLSLPFVGTLKVGSYYHVYGPKETA